MIRVVIDTNILVSALLQPSGLPAQVIVLALSGSVQMCVSGDVYAEYEEVISRPRFQRDETLFPVTCLGSNFSAGGCAGCGGTRYRGAASAVESTWTGLTGS
jgi:hypothetical protein